MTAYRCWLLALIFLSCVGTAEAHKPSDSYLTITGGAKQLTAEWDIALKDLEFLIGLDADRNGEITWGELKAQQHAVTAHVLSRLRISADGRDCKVHAAELKVSRHSDGAYAALVLQTDAPGDAAVLNVQYSLLFDVDPTHRGLVLYNNAAVTSTFVLSPAQPSVELRTNETRLWNSFAEYVREGVWHIWIGYDHILFLLSLLLPAVLMRSEMGWQPVEASRPACLAVLRIVTVFTLAHSITLWLAVMEYVRLPGQLVESTIALSIVAAALHNLYPVLPLSGWGMAFAFGLVHGFGFANVLIDLGLSNAALGLSLLGFNLGVELGQLAIVLAFFPLAFVLRRSTVYEWLFLRSGSIAIALIAGVWMYERIFNARVL